MSVTENSASQQHVQTAAAASSVLQPSDLPELSVQQDSSEHGRLVPRGASPCLGGSGRDTQPSLDKGRAPSSTPRADRRRHGTQCEEPKQGCDSLPGPHQGTEQGLREEEERGHQVLRGHLASERAGGRQQDGGSAPDDGHEQDHAGVPSRCHGSGQFRQALQLPVSRDPGPALRVRQVGSEDLPRGQSQLRSAVPEIGKVAHRAGEGRAPARQVDPQEDLPGVHQRPCHNYPDAGLQHRLLLHGEQHLQGDDRCHSRPPEGGTEPQAGAGSEEGPEARRERSRDRRLLHACEPEPVSENESCEEAGNSSTEVEPSTLQQDGSNLSASEKLSQQLSLGRARKLEEQAWSVVPDLFQSLAAEGRPVLMEVCCSPTSSLSSTIQEMTGDEGSASRCSHWNCGDLSTDKGLRHTLRRLKVENPAHVWLSPPCGPDSPLQNGNCRTPEQKAQLEEKRREAMKIYVACCVLLHVCVQKGIHVTLELAERCQAWRLPLFHNLQNKYSLYSSVTKGCRVGLRSKKDGQLLQKGWRIVTSCKRLADTLNLSCHCSRHYKHGRCEGGTAKDSELYTPEFTRRASKVILQELDHASIVSEIQGQSHLPQQFGEGVRCMCSDVSLPKRSQLCGQCLMQSCPGVSEGSGRDTSDPSNEGGVGLGGQVEARTQPEGQGSGDKVGVFGVVVAGSEGMGLGGQVRAHTQHEQGCVTGSPGDGLGGQVSARTQLEGQGSGDQEASWLQNQSEEEPTGQGWFSQSHVNLIESLAKDLLSRKQFDHRTCEQLIEMLAIPHNRQHRGLLGPGPAQYLVLGAYSHGNQYGITKQTQELPETTRYLLKYLQHYDDQDTQCSSMVINYNSFCPRHRDIHNDGKYCNRLIGLGDYQGGDLWLEGSEGSEGTRVWRSIPNQEHARPGVLHNTRYELVKFSPKQWHGPETWKGVRMTLTSYVTRGHQFLTKEERNLLINLGFLLPEKDPPGQEEAHVAGPMGPRRHEDPKTFRERIRKQLYLLHSATGHGSVKSMVTMLKRRNADPQVIKLAQDFKCSICAEKKQVQPRHLASLEVLPPKWHTLSADIGHWKHPVSGEHVQFMLIIDEGSRFRVAKVLSKGSKQQPNAATCLGYLREGWAQYFGLPRTLRLDPAGAFRGQAVVDFCDKEGIYLDNTPADAHWQIGVCEQAVKGTKTVLDKLCAEESSLSSEEALAIAIRVFNQRETIRGFSPMQHAFGRSPDSTDRLIENSHGVPDDLLIEWATQEFETSARLRAEAEKAHAEWNAAQRISRAVNSKSRPRYPYQPGDLVYFWRSQVSGQGRQQPGSKKGMFLGPARILATGSRREIDGTLRPGSAIWCIRGRQLLKCSPEQLRPASEREELLETLARENGELQTPWTFTRLSEEIGGNSFQDLSHEVPSEPEWLRAQDVEQEEQPVRFRFRRKRAAPEPVAEELSGQTEGEEPSQSSRSHRPRGVPPTMGFGSTEQSRWQDTVPECCWSAQECSFWAEEQAAVAIEISMPETDNQWNKALHNLSSFFVGALKRQAVEVSEKRLTPEERQQFKEAKNVEVRNFIAAKAFEALPAHLQPSRDQAVHMRWILTWKAKEDGSQRAKARAVLLGYQDPSYEFRATTAPVMTKQSRQLLLQLAANEQWHVYKGDVTGAFLQGRQYPGEMYCVPCPEICEAMGIPPNSVTKLQKACYGLVEAPLEWYRTISSFLESLGLTRLWSDPCCWIWQQQGRTKGVVSGHVDDFLFSGAEDNQQWQKIIAQIKEKFKWGDWEKDNFTQCGPVNSSRRKRLSESTTPWEKSQLRALLGALSWNAQQVAPHVSADVGLLLSEVNSSTVGTLLKANTLLSHAKARKDHQMIVHHFPPETPLGMFAWVDASSQNRVCGGSTEGLFLGLGPLSLLRGEVCPITPVIWHSHKIERVCRSPGAAETQAAVNGEDHLYYARYQWSEMLHGPADTKAPDNTVRKVPGCVISDSRNVYDKLQTEVVTIKGAEKRSNIELLSLKEAQHRTQVQVRWVHSEAQLGNALTKAGGGRELELYYRMGHQWRIVEDVQMRSARRRKTDGLAPLQSATSSEAAAASRPAERAGLDSHAM